MNDGLIGRICGPVRDTRGELSRIEPKEPVRRWDDGDDPFYEPPRSYDRALGRLLLAKAGLL